MDQLAKLMSDVANAKDALSDAESQRDKFLEPIFNTLGITSGGIGSVSIYGESLHLERVGSTRGCSWSNDYQFPVSIFQTADPIAEALKFVASTKKQKEDADRSAKQKQLLQLQAELGIASEPTPEATKGK